MPGTPRPDLQTYVSKRLIKILDRNMAEVRYKFPHDHQDLPDLDYESDEDYGDTYIPQ